MARHDKKFLERYRFHAKQGGGVIGRNAVQAWRAALAEERAESLADEGRARYVIERDDSDPAELFDEETHAEEIQKLRDGTWEWLYIRFETRDEACRFCEAWGGAADRAEGCEHGGWKHAASIGGVSVATMDDPYIRVLRAELAIEAGICDSPTFNVVP